VPTMGVPPAWGLGEGLTAPHRKKTICYEMLHSNWNWRALVNTVMNLRVPQKEEGNFLTG